MTFEERIQQNKKLSNLGNYIIVGAVSIISCVFLPLLGSNVEVEFIVPKGFGPFMMWIMSKVSIAIVNMLIFYCFIQQAKLNVKEDPRFVEANEKMIVMKEKVNILPRSPKVFMKKQWLTKGTVLLILTILSTIFLAECVLNFDLAQFLTYVFTVAISLAFSYLNMRNNEDYWVSEYPLYVNNLFKDMPVDDDFDDFLDRLIEQSKTIKEE